MASGEASLDKIHPDLDRQMNEAGSTQTVAAVVYPKRAANMSSSEVEALAHKMVESASQKSKQSPQRLQVYGNLGSFLVTGTVPFLRTLLAEPEVGKASPGHRDDSAYIAPVDARPVQLDDVKFDKPARPAKRKRK